MSGTKLIRSGRVTALVAFYNQKINDFLDESIEHPEREKVCKEKAVLLMNVVKDLKEILPANN